MSIDRNVLRLGTSCAVALAAIACLGLAVQPAQAMRGGGGGGHAGGGHMGGHFSGGHFGGMGHYGGHAGYPGGYPGARPGANPGAHRGAYAGYGHGYGYGGYGGLGYGGWGHPGGYGYGYHAYHPYGWGWGGFYNPYLYGYGYWPNVPNDYPNDQAYAADYDYNADDENENGDETPIDEPNQDAAPAGNYGDYAGPQPPAAGGFTPHVDAAPNPKDQRPHDRGAIHIVVPNAYAIVSFDGQKMLGTGKDRMILTPTIEPGHDFGYQVQATWTDAAGKTTTQVREGVIKAGQFVVADFTKPQPQSAPVVTPAETAP
ncbi:MAG: TIGR03000 domain-containing protein [Pirellulales bacterium]